ncbi:hypothetical protein [Bacillus phage vB_BanS-Thrax3]|nr:hypothetical protein [Bacillus phage vB_BanS-Thrax3]
MKFQVYKAMSGKYRISETYGLSEEVYRKLKKVGLPVYKSMSGSLNLRDSRSYTKEQILKIKELVGGN